MRKGHYADSNRYDNPRRVQTFLERTFAKVPGEIRRRLKYDKEAQWSATNMDDADSMSKRLLKHMSPEDTLTDATACIGGNVLSFSKHFAHVNAIELNDTRTEYLVNNVSVLGLDNVTVIHGNALDEVPRLNQTCVFMDLPWGGPDYWKEDRIDLFLHDKNGPVNMIDVCKRFRPYCEFIAMKIPENFDLPKFIWETFDDFKILDIVTSYRKMNLLIIQRRYSAERETHIDV